MPTRGSEVPRAKRFRKAAVPLNIACECLTRKLDWTGAATHTCAEDDVIAFLQQVAPIVVLTGCNLHPTIGDEFGPAPGTFAGHAGSRVGAHKS